MKWKTVEGFGLLALSAFEVGLLCLSLSDPSLEDVEYFNSVRKPELFVSTHAQTETATRTT